MLEWNALLSGYIGQLILLVAVIFIRLMTDRFIPMEPMYYFRLYCDLLARKVNKASHSNKQLIISGTIATLVTILPLVSLFALFELFVDVLWLWNAFLLWLALGWFATKYDANRVSKALKNKQTQLARESIKHRLLRKTANLSPLGLSKATIETNILRFNAEFVCVVFYALLFNPLIAITYRLLYEIHLSWNPSYVQFQYFGKPIKKVVAIMQWPVSRFIGFVSIITSGSGNLMLMFRMTSNSFWHLSSTYLLQCHALMLGVSLGGPAIYNELKVRRPIANNLGRQPCAEDISKSLQHLNTLFMFILTLLILIAGFSLLNFIESK